MGSIKIRNGATGTEEIVDETATPQDLRKKFGLSPDYSFINGKGERLQEGQEIGRSVKEDEVITPVSEPKFGAYTPSFSYILLGWDSNRVREQYSILKSRIKDAQISNDFSMILIPRLPIDSRKFNKSYTRLLISFNRNFHWMDGPGFYVDRNLRVNGRKSQHLDEYLTEHEMLEAGFVKLCWYNPVRSKNIESILKGVVTFLERLNK